MGARVQPGQGREGSRSLRASVPLPSCDRTVNCGAAAMPVYDGGVARCRSVLGGERFKCCHYGVGEWVAVHIRWKGRKVR